MGGYLLKFSGEFNNAGNTVGFVNIADIIDVGDKYNADGYPF